MKSEISNSALLAVAKGLLQQRDEKRRKRQGMLCAAAFIICFALHSYVSNNFTSPLKLIPQMGLAFFMGYLFTLGASLRKFGIVAEFIAWEKVEATINDKGA